MLFILVIQHGMNILRVKTKFWVGHTYTHISHSQRLKSISILLPSKSQQTMPEYTGYQGSKLKMKIKYLPFLLNGQVVDLSLILGLATISCLNILVFNIYSLLVQSVQAVLDIHIVTMILAIHIVLQVHPQLMIIYAYLVPKELSGMETHA